MLLLLSLLVTNKPAVDPLVRAFRNPPASAKPHTWWHWMDGNITKAGIKADLQAMQEAGIGGAHIFDVGQGVPSGPIAYNSQEWRDLMVYALREAKTRGLDMTMHNCSGWSSSAGPWVKPAEAMKKLVFSTGTFGGPGRPKAPPAPNSQGYYRDVAFYVLPTSNPPGKTSLQPLTGLGANPGQITRLDWPVAENSILLPPSRMTSDGTLTVTIPQGDWTVLRIGETNTGAQNVASRDSGRGLEVDKLSATSLDRFLDGGLNPLLNQLGKNSSLATVLVDSYETGYNNWTPGILSEFRARRGYDAARYLPTLAGYVIENEATTLGFLFDYRKTISDLWAQNYSGHFARRLAERGLKLAIEPYGNGNFDPFTFAKPAGLIMGEYWVGDSQINPAVKHAASVAHVYGHNVVGAEALTATPEQAGWRNQPRQWKPFADHAMTLGINRIIYHRFAHQPWVSNVLPGMTMGPWGSHVDRGNTVWPYMPNWNLYLSRCQFLLQQGNFVGDVLLFSGEDSPQSYAGEGQTLPEVPPGYDFDFCGLDPLKSVKVKNGRLLLPNGASYAVLALPITARMSLPLLKEIKRLADAGAKIVGPKPDRTPSLAEMQKGGDAEVRRIANQVWSKVVSGKSLGEVLKGLTPDFSANTAGVRAIHRRIGRTEAYFVASSQPYPIQTLGRFRSPSSAVNVQFWHPETGEVEDASTWKRVGSQIEVPISFESDGSVFVMISPVTKERPHLIGTQVTTAAARAKPEPPLRILKAVYGDQASGKVKDVTMLVAKAAGPHSLRISASNGDMGGDPAVNIVKTLSLTYQFGEQLKTVVVRENGKVEVGNLPEPGTPPVAQIQGNRMLVWQNGEFGQTWSGGKNRKIKVQNVKAPVELKGAWTVSFPPGWDAPAQVTYPTLKSWTESENFGIRHFSGNVRYRKTFSVAKGQLGRDERLYLDLGDVREMCRVWLNGKRVAEQWKPPFRMDISDHVRAGENRLEVEVTNLWVNRLIGDEQFPDDMGWNGSQLSGWPEWFVKGQPRPEPRRKTFTTWRHNFKDTPLMPSGLLGPVTLRWVRVLTLKP